MSRALRLLTLLILISSVVCLNMTNIHADEEDAVQYKAGKKATFPFYIYKDKLARENHYIPSGWMGDYSAIRLNDAWKDNPHSGRSCIQFKYTGEATQGSGWAACLWQNPANNWGRTKGGFDLTSASKVTFWARGDKGGEVVEFKIGGLYGENYADTAEKTTGPIVLAKDWKEYSIDLKDADLSYIGGGFCWAVSSNDVPEGGVTFYLDDIVYLK